MLSKDDSGLESLALTHERERKSMMCDGERNVRRASGTTQSPYIVMDKVILATEMHIDRVRFGRKLCRCR